MMKKPLLIDLDYAFTGSFSMKEICVPYFVNTHHFHDDYELVLVLESSGNRIIGNHVGNFKKGDMVLVGPKLAHAWFNDQEYYDGHEELLARSIVTYFKKSWLEGQLSELAVGAKFKEMREGAARGMKINGITNKRVTDLLMKALHAPHLLKAAGIFTVLHELTETSEFELLADAAYNNASGHNEASRINEVYEYVIQNFTTEIRLDIAADIANMSPNAFCRYFKSHTQRTFSHFVNEIRVGHACKLLQKDDLSISQVCYASGFQSMSNFIKFFKRYMKKSPLQYRKNLYKINPTSHRPNQ